MEYEYEQGMEEAYLQSLFKSFKKTVDGGLFPFIIVDAINDKVKSFEPFWSYAKSKGFQVSHVACTCFTPVLMICVITFGFDL